MIDLNKKFEANGYETTLLNELLLLGVEAWEHQDDTHNSNVIVALIKNGIADGTIEYLDDDDTGDEDGIEDWDMDHMKFISELRTIVNEM